MADKRIFQLDDEGFLDDLTDKVYMWLDKKTNEGEPDEPSWKFKANVFLKILNNFATKFVPNVLTVEGKCYWHDGELFMCNVAYTGDWVPGNFTATSIDALFARIADVTMKANLLGTASTDADMDSTHALTLVKNDGTQKKLPANLVAKASDVAALQAQTNNIDNNLGVYDIGTIYNTLNPSYSRVMAVFPIKDVDSTFVWKITDKSTNGNINIRITSEATPYASDILETAATIGSNDTSGEGSFTISSANKSAAKYIVVLNATANLLVSFNLELWTKISVVGELKETKSVVDFLNEATIISQTRFEQGGINGTTGENAESNAVVKPDKHIDVDDLVSVSLGSSSGLHVQLYSYNASGSYLGRNDLGANAFSYNSKQIKAYRNAKFVTFSIYLDGGGNFSPSDLETNGKFSIKMTTISTIPKMNKNTNSDFSLLLKSAGSTPMATWVDDDGVVTHANGGISGVIIPVAEAVGIPVTFAVIPPLSDSVVVSGVTMTRGEYFNALQKKGHQIVSHPEHTYWYGANYNLDKVKETLIESLQDLQEYKMLHSDMLVYPGSSATNPDVVEQVRKWCVCGVRSGYGTPNHLGDSTKWDIKRTFVNFADYYSLHSSDPGFVSSMAWYKSQVDAAFANGDWIVFGTHSYQFTTSEDTTDPNANTLGNLKELMQYAVTKGLEFRTLWDAYNRRKFLYYFKEMNA